MALNAAELHGLEVRYKEYLLADELLGLIEHRDATDDSTLVRSVKNRELQELLGLLDLLAGFYLAYADIACREVVDAYLSDVCELLADFSCARIFVVILDNAVAIAKVAVILTLEYSPLLSPSTADE